MLKYEEEKLQGCYSSLVQFTTVYLKTHNSSILWAETSTFSLFECCKKSVSDTQALSHFMGCILEECHLFTYGNDKPQIFINENKY